MPRDMDENVFVLDLNIGSLPPSAFNAMGIILWAFWCPVNG
jgi:hypothetical protein